MSKITIIGFGRFGKTLYRLIKDDFEITIFNTSKIPQEDRINFTKNTKIAKNLEEAYKSDVIFFAIPISLFESVIKQHKQYFKSSHALIDVLSVKMHPAKIFKKYLQETKTQALLTHPMFGPDSSKNGFDNLPIIINQFISSNETYTFWKEYFLNKKLRVIELSPKEHDKLAANSLGVAQFIGRVLGNLNLKPTPIDSLGAIKLQEVRQQACHDTWELFYDLQTYNPYTKSMRLKLGVAYDKLYNKLLPKRVNKRFITYGIQGGKGSFNEEAIKSYISKHNIKKYRIKYLYTSEKVLRNLHEGNIDYGLFAIHNATGGIVGESIHAMARYTFKIVDEPEIIIRHFLMKKKDIPFKKITTIMAHSQNLKQCTVNLAKKYPTLQQESGEGDLADTAKAASYLAIGKLSEHVAILGPKILSTIYNLEIIDENLQDREDNFTSFLLVSNS